MSRFLALATISCAILAYEVLLTRLFAIVQWHHFAFMAISIALLGFGVSGAALALWRRAVERRLDEVFTACALSFAIASPAAFLVAQRVPFNALELVWNPAQLLALGAIYLILAVPFTAGAACIGTAFLRRTDTAGRIYFWNLLGSAAGALGVVFTLSVLTPVGNLAVVSALGLIAATLSLAADSGRRAMAAGAVLLLAATAGWTLAPASWTALRVAEHKGLSLALSVEGAELVQERFGPLGLVSVVESPRVPFRSAPGLSLNAPAPPPEQVALFTDADAMTTIDRDAGATPADYLRYMTDALVYSLAQRPEVLVLAAGGGRQVARALAHGAARVDAVEPNPDIVGLVRGDYADFAGRLYDRDEVTVHIADARGFLAATERQWHVIIVEGGSAGAGLQGLNESTLLTVDAVALLLRRLRPGGWLSFTQALKLPPRAAPKLMATALEALGRRGAADPADHLVLIRGIATTTLLVGRDPVTAPEVAAAAAFAEARSFDLAYHPGIARTAANRFNILADPVFFDAAAGLTGPGRDDFVARYKFDITPATDDRPYFHDFFRWRSLPELLAKRSAGGAALLELGELVLFGTLVQALLISLVLILLPLRAAGLARGRGSLVWRTGGYFTAIGLAFLFVELAFIHKFILFLGHPTTAVAVVLAGFLVFAGIGARISERLAQAVAARLGTGRPTAAIEIAVAGLALAAIGLLLVTPVAFAALAGLPTIGRALVSLTLIAPLAFFMGMPFPLGLALINRADRALTPWAWGVNGCASVVSAILAVLLAMHLGFAAVVVIALVLYAIATAAVRGIAPNVGPRGSSARSARSGT